MERKIQQLGLDDPLGLIWELTPYSFVVDWFLPVGQWLSSFRSIKGLTFQGGYTYVKSQGRGYWRYKAYPWSRPSNVTTTYLSKWRIPLNTFPSYHWEGFTPEKFGLRQVAHTAALVAQKIWKR